jgi:flagellar motor switch protein FliM
MKRALSQQEIDSLFSGSSATRSESGEAVLPFDFSRLDRIPKSQVRIVHALYETFIRNIATSLAGFLRTYVSPTLVSLEQISYGEFLESLETPTCLAYVGLRPFDGTMLVGLSRSLVFGSVDLLLGGDGQGFAVPSRKLTDIEKNLIQNMLRVYLADFRDAWASVAEIQFDVQSLADDQHGLRVLTATEAVVSVSIEIKIGQTTSMINMAIPSIFIKRLRDRFERLHSVQRAASRREDQGWMAALVQQVGLDVEVRLGGGTVSAQDVADLEVGDILMLDHASDRPVEAYLNDRLMFVGAPGAADDRMHYTVTARAGDL